MGERWAARAGSKWTAAAVAALLLTGGLALDAAPVAAALHNPIPMNASEEPTYEFVDDDALLAYVTSDIRGGYICVVPEAIEDPADGSCEDANWAKTNAVVGIGSVITLVAGPPLKEGAWRLLVEDSDHVQTALSEVFTVTPCEDCSRDVSDLVVAEWKARAADMQIGLTLGCTAMSIKKAADSASPLGVAKGLAQSVSDRLPSVDRGDTGFVANVNGAFGGLLDMGIPSLDAAIGAGASKALEILHQLSCMASSMYADIVADPPDPSYGSVEHPRRTPIYDTDSDELDALIHQIDDQSAQAESALTAYERFLGAEESHAGAAAITQLRAASDITLDQVAAMTATAKALDAYAATLDDQGLLQGPIASPEDFAVIKPIYERVAATGFVQAEIDQMHGLGFSDTQIAAIRTHFMVPIGDLDPSQSLPQIIRTLADTTRDQEEGFLAFARETSAVASRRSTDDGNTSPVAADDEEFVGSGQTVYVPVLDNDSDAENDPLTLQLLDPPAHGSAQCGYPAGSCSYSSSGAYVGPDSFTYLVSDGRGGSDVGTVRLDVRDGDTNHDPVAEDDAITLAQGAYGYLDVLANDHDADVDALRMSVDTPPDHAEVACARIGGQCNVVTEPGYVGSDEFTYVVDDGSGGSATATVTITTNEGDTSTGVPVAKDDTQEAMSGVPSGLAVTRNDTNPASGPLLATAFRQPDHGSVQCTEAFCRYESDSGFVGTDSYRYVASNATHAAAATVTVEVVPDPEVRPEVAISSDGPLTEIAATKYLNCAVRHAADAANEFFDRTACGTFLLVEGMIYGPRRVPAGIDAGVFGVTPWRPVSQDLEGTGTAQDPFRLTSIVVAGGTGIRLTQVDSYVIGLELYRTDVTISSTGSAAQTVRLYRGGDCFLQNSDAGYGLVNGDAVACRGAGADGPGSRIQQWRPLTGGSTYFEGHYGSLWAAIRSGNAFPNTCVCDSQIDNGAGLSWGATVPPGGSTTISHQTLFSPDGRQPLVLSKTADDDGAEPGEATGYTITVANLNDQDETLGSLTDHLPAGFEYEADSTTGAFDTDPVIDDQDLTWDGPIAVPAGEEVTVHFDVTVADEPGTYLNEVDGTSDDLGVVGTGPTAPVLVAEPDDVECIDYSTGFVDDGGLIVNDDAAIVDGVLRLTAASGDQRGSAFGAHSLDVSSDLGFDTSFQFRMSDPGGIGDAGGQNGADGLAFLFVNTPDTPTGSLGGGLGYAGIDNSVAIEFDTWQNSGTDPDGNHVGVQPNGDTSEAGSLVTVHADALPVLADGELHDVGIRYIPPSLPHGLGLSVTLDGEEIIRLPDFELEDYVDLDGRSYIGFTAATGSAWQVHEIVDFAGCVTDGTDLNQAPTATAQSVTTPKGTAKAIVLAGADADDDELTFEIVDGPTHGTLAGSGATRTYSPNAGYHGPDSFTFRVSDGTDSSAAATVSITVTEVVTPPTTPPTTPPVTSPPIPVVATPDPCDAASTATVTPAQAVPGASTHVTDGCFAGSALLAISFESDPVALGTTISDATGHYAIDAVVPLGATPGIHHVVVTGAGQSAAAHRSAGQIEVLDLDCDDVSAAEAAALLGANPADPHDLDGDHDGVPCEAPAAPRLPLPRTGAGRIQLLLLLAGAALFLGGRLLGASASRSARGGS